MFGTLRRRAALLATGALTIAMLFVPLSPLAPPAHAAGLGAVTGVSVTGDTLDISVGSDKLIVQLVRSDIVKVDYRPGGTADPVTPVVDPNKTWGSGYITSVDTNSDPMVVTTSQLTVKIAKVPARLSVYDSTGALVLSEQAAEGVHADGVKFNHTAGEKFYGITGNPLPWAEKDPKQNLAEGMQRNDGGRVSAGMQGDGGAPLAFTNRYGLLVDSVDGDFNITNTALEFSGVSTSDVSYYVAVGPPKQVMSGVAEISGKPDMSPKWALGFHNSEWGTTQAEVSSIVQGYRNRRIPLDVFTLDFDFKAWGEDNYGEFRWNSTSGAGNVHPNKFPDGASGAFATSMGNQGVKLNGIMKPRVVLEKAGGGTTVQGQWMRDNGCVYPGRADYPEYFSGRLANDTDFSKQNCRDWYWQHAKPLFDTGIVGWWNDEADEANGVLFDSLQHVNMQRSLYDGQRAAADKRVFSLNRNFYLGGQRYGYGMWSGDIDTGFTSMAEQRTRMLTSLNLGETKWGMDIGGFSGDPSPENYARWMQFGAFVPIYRVHGTFDKQRQPWLYGAEVEGVAKRAIELRSKLLPYMYAHERTNYETGIGLVRPLLYDYPSDPTAANETAEWMFGESLLAAPVVEQGAKTKRVYLPEGKWTDYFRGTTYTGPTTVDYPVSLQDVPLFVKAGAIIPTQDVQQHVDDGTVRQYVMDVFPTNGRSEFTVYDDDGRTRAYESGTYFKQRVTARRAGDSVVVETQPKTGSFNTALTHHIVKINATSGTAARINGQAPTRYNDLAALKSAPGEGWATGTDQYGPYIAVRVAAGVAKTVEVDGAAHTRAVTTKAEAEDAALSGGAAIATNHAGYSGQGFVDGYTGVGAATTFTVQAAAKGEHVATLRYSNGTGSPKTLSMTVNGVRDQVTLPTTANWDTWADKAVRIPLNAGSNTITYSYGSGDSGNVNLDYLSLSDGPPACEPRHEAETAALSGGASTATDHLEYSGGGFVDGYWNQGATTSFTVKAAKTGNYAATLRYANATGSSKTVTMTVNGTPTRITLPDLAHWDTWADHTTQVSLRAGDNTVSYSYAAGDSGNVNLDYLTIAPGASPCTLRAEAEHAALSGGTQRIADHIGYSGAGFVDRYTSPGATTTFTIHSSKAGTFPLTLRYANATGSTKTITMSVNGNRTQLSLPPFADWDTWNDHTRQVSLNAGSNTVSFSYEPTDSGNVNLDRVSVDF